MNNTCLNPQCSNDTATIGVCVACANDHYKPKSTGCGGFGYDYNTKEDRTNRL